MSDAVINPGIRQQITVKSRAAGSFVDGEFVEGPETQTQIYASVQPASGDDFKILPELSAGQAAIRVFSSAQIFSGNEISVRRGDLISWQGEDWRVNHVERWVALNLAHYDALAIREARNA